MIFSHLFKFPRQFKFNFPYFFFQLAVAFVKQTGTEKANLLVNVTGLLQQLPVAFTNTLFLNGQLLRETLFYSLNFFFVPFFLLFFDFTAHSFINAFLNSGLLFLNFCGCPLLFMLNCLHGYLIVKDTEGYWSIFFK